MLNCLAVGTGGFLGSVLRYGISQLPLGTQAGFPWKTFFINLAGCFLIGVLAALALRRPAPDPRLVLCWKVGGCGGFTTFSSFALETGSLLQSGSAPAALAYAVLSLVLGVLAVFAGQMLFR